MVFSGGIFLYLMKVEESFMVKEDLRNAELASFILGIVDAYLLWRRIFGEPVFQLPFELMIFYLPLILLVTYCIYLKEKASRHSLSQGASCHSVKEDNFVIIALIKLMMLLFSLKVTIFRTY